MAVATGDDDDDWVAFDLLHTSLPVGFAVTGSGESSRKMPNLSATLVLVFCKEKHSEKSGCCRCFPSGGSRPDECALGTSLGENGPDGCHGDGASYDRSLNVGRLAILLIADENPSENQYKLDLNLCCIPNVWLSCVVYLNEVRKILPTPGHR